MLARSSCAIEEKMRAGSAMGRDEPEAALEHLTALLAQVLLRGVAKEVKEEDVERGLREREDHLVLRRGRWRRDRRQ